MVGLGPQSHSPIPLRYPSVLFVGVENDGTVTDNGNIEDLMKSYSGFIANGCYPPIYNVPRVLTHNVESCVAVIIPGSEARPHFAGLSYVRDGTQTREASEEQFRSLIAQRLRKARELLNWRGKAVTVEHVRPTTHGSVAGLHRSPETATLTGCNEFYVTLSDEKRTFSYTLADIELSFDHVPNRLKLELRY